MVVSHVPFASFLFGLLPSELDKLRYTSFFSFFGILFSLAFVVYVSCSCRAAAAAAAAVCCCLLLFAAVCCCFAVGFVHCLPVACIGCLCCAPGMNTTSVWVKTESTLWVCSWQSHGSACFRPFRFVQWWQVVKMFGPFCLQSEAHFGLTRVCVCVYGCALCRRCICHVMMLHALVPDFECCILRCLQRTSLLPRAAQPFHGQSTYAPPCFWELAVTSLFRAWHMIHLTCFLCCNKQSVLWSCRSCVNVLLPCLRFHGCDRVRMPPRKQPHSST